MNFFESVKSSPFCVLTFYCSSCILDLGAKLSDCAATTDQCIGGSPSKETGWATGKHFPR